MLGRYDRIEKVMLEDTDEIYLLTGDDVSAEFEVDLCEMGNLFNELGVITRETVKEVDNLEDIQSFLKDNNIPILKIKDGQAIVGGSSDMGIDNDLSFDWIEEKEL